MREVYHFLGILTLFFICLLLSIHTMYDTRRNSMFPVMFGVKVNGTNVWYYQEHFSLFVRILFVFFFLPFCFCFVGCFCATIRWFANWCATKPFYQTLFASSQLKNVNSVFIVVHPRFIWKWNNFKSFFL